MTGLMLKSIRETRVLTLLLTAALALVMGLLTSVLPRLIEQASDALLQIGFAKAMISALLGIQIEDVITAEMLQGLVWVHPIVLAIIWTHVITFCTRTPAGEIDRGTIDLLLGWPVSRRQVYLADSGVLLASGLLMLLAGLGAHLLGSLGIDAENRPALGRSLLVLLNFLCLYISVGGVAYLVSSLSDRRGRAVAITLGVVMASFLLNFLAQLWEPARPLAFLSVLDYYRPARILRSGSIPTTDMLVLLGVGVTTWLAGGITMARRSICTV